MTTTILDSLSHFNLQKLFYVFLVMVVLAVKYITTKHNLNLKKKPQWHNTTVFLGLYSIHHCLIFLKG